MFARRLLCVCALLSSAQAGTLTSVTVALQNTVSSGSGYVQFTLTTATSIPADGKIKATESWLTALELRICSSSGLLPD